jgi:HTH-type transcriptional regulator, sugar sensing transcriptional regulator
MEPLIVALKKLNLTEKEAQVYLALLELGPSTPYKIAKRSRLKRPTAYVIAEELVEKGLIVQMTGEKQKMYIARSPESYIEDIEKRVHEARKVVPELLAMQRKGSDKPNILYFEGTRGLKQAYEYKIKELKGREIVGFFARGNDIDSELQNEVFIPWNETRTEKNIDLRGFTVDDPKLHPYKKFYGTGKGEFNAKFLPESLYDADCSIEALEDAVRVVIMRSKQSVIIESSEFARAIRQVFELLWERTHGEFDTPEKFKLEK